MPWRPGLNIGSLRSSVSKWTTSPGKIWHWGWIGCEWRKECTTWCKWPAFGKKSRLAVHVQVLTRPDMLDDVVRLCFQETTTIGLRTHMVQGRTLTRRFAAGEIDGHSVTTKLVERPGGILTGKAEAEHLRDIASHAGRVQIRRQAEAQATTADLDQERTKR